MDLQGPKSAALNVPSLIGDRVPVESTFLLGQRASTHLHPLCRKAPLQRSTQLKKSKATSVPPTKIQIQPMIRSVTEPPIIGKKRAACWYVRSAIPLMFRAKNQPKMKKSSGPRSKPFTFYPTRSPALHELFGEMVNPPLPHGIT